MTQKRVWTERVTFQRPFLLKAVGEELPAGTYSFTFEEVTIYMRGHPIPQIMRCMLSVPKALVPPNMLALDIAVDDRELRAKHAIDQQPLKS